MTLKSLLIPTLNQVPSRGIIPVAPPGAAIPRIIHQTYFSHELPDPIRANVENIRALNPGWEYRFYDDTAIISFIRANYSPEILDYFNRIDSRYGAAKADLFRYLLMYKVGGVYLDIKSQARMPLDEVLKSDDRFLLSVWEDKFGECHGWGDHYELRHIPAGEFQQWHIVCAPGHPFMKSVLENVLSNVRKYTPAIHGVGKPGVLRVTGPIAYTLAIHPILEQHPYRQVDSRYDLGFEYNIYQGRSHESVLKSHYSLQTSSLVKLGLRRRLSSRIYGLAQYLFDTIKKRNRPSHFTVTSR
jgi:mannosyltransferase OCH1-like enzyme